MKEDEAFDPVHVGVFGAKTVVPDKPGISGATLAPLAAPEPGAAKF